MWIFRIIGSPRRRYGDRHGLHFLLLVMLILFNFHFVSLYSKNMENSGILFHVLNQIQSIDGNVFHLYKADIVESFPYIDNVSSVKEDIALDHNIDYI